MTRARAIDAPCPVCSGYGFIRRAVPSLPHPCGTAQWTPAAYLCRACRGSGLVGGFECVSCHGPCYEGDRFHGAPTVGRDGRCSRCVEHDLGECGTCLDGAVVTDTCDDCDERHCWDCEPCAVENQSETERALLVSLATGRDVEIETAAGPWTIRCGVAR